MNINQHQTGIIPGSPGASSTTSFLHPPKPSVYHVLSSSVKEPAHNSCRRTQYVRTQSTSEYLRSHSGDFAIYNTAIVPCMASTSDNTNYNTSSEFLSPITSSSCQSSLASSGSSSSLSSIQSTSASVLSTQNENSNLLLNIPTYSNSNLSTTDVPYWNLQANSDNNTIVSTITNNTNHGYTNTKHIGVSNIFYNEECSMTTDSINNSNDKRHFLLDIGEKSLNSGGSSQVTSGTMFHNYNDQGRLPPFSDLTWQLRNGPVFMVTNNDSRTKVSGRSSGVDDDDMDGEQKFTELSLANLAYNDVNEFDLDHVSFEPKNSDDNLLDNTMCNLVNMKVEQMEQPCHEFNTYFHSDLHLFNLSDPESGYDSSYEQPSQGFYGQLGASYRDLLTNTTWNRQSSPESDEGFVDEPNMPENVPNFEKIQDHPTDSEKRQPIKRSSASRKEKKKARDSPKVTDRERRKPGRKPGQVSNVLHLWEFMRDLLQSTQSVGIIEWISKPEGVFRVVNSTEVARQWGQKKKNKKQMTYEKLSRSLRYSRREGYFSELPEDKNYPKKLCFKFGPKSKDWH